jgi:signal peptidase I
MTPAVETDGQRAVVGDRESLDSPLASAASEDPGGVAIPERERFDGSRESVSSAPVSNAGHHHHHHSFLEAFQSLLYVIVIALFIMTFAVQPFRIPSASMEPTLLVGDFLLVDKEIGSEATPRVFAPTNEIGRGDLIVFHYPIDPSLHLVKRVIGLPGDRVRLRDGRAFVNGEALDEPYAMFRPAAADSYRDDFPRMDSADPGVESRWWIEMRSLVSGGELTVPPDSYFVLGDNRNDSQDSRYWGFVPRADIVGKPFLIYFSLNSSRQTPGQSAANAMAGGSTASDSTGGPLNRLVRWERALRVIH